MGQCIVAALMATDPRAAIEEIARDAEFARLVPELQRLRDVPQDPGHHAEGNVWIHTMMVVVEAAKLGDAPGMSAFDRRAMLIGALFHDVGKGVEGGTQIKPDGHGGVKITAIGHEKLGVAPVREILERLGLEEYSRPVLAVVEHHMALPGRYREVERGNMTLERCVTRTRALIAAELQGVNPEVLLNCTIADWRGRGTEETRAMRETFIEGFCGVFRQSQALH
jgi:tRNA nucleotidyltransferase (CCA-adding enzyme)